MGKSKPRLHSEPSSSLYLAPSGAATPPRSERLISPELALAADGERRVAGAGSAHFSLSDLAALASNVFYGGDANASDQARHDLLRGGEPDAGPRTGSVQAGFEIMFPEARPAVHEQLAAHQGQARTTPHPETPTTVAGKPGQPAALPHMPGDTAAGYPTAQDDDENAADGDDGDGNALSFASADGMWQTSNQMFGLGTSAPPGTPPDPAAEATPQARSPGAVAAAVHPPAGPVRLPCPDAGVQEGFAHGRPLREICHLHGFRPELVPEEWEEYAQPVQVLGLEGWRAATHVLVTAPNVEHDGIPEPCEAAPSVLDVQSTTEARSWQQTMRMLGPAAATSSQLDRLGVSPPSSPPPSPPRPGRKRRFCPPASPHFYGTHADTDEGMPAITEEEEAVLAPEEVNAMIVRLIGLRLQQTSPAQASGEDGVFVYNTHTDH